MRRVGEFLRFEILDAIGVADGFQARAGDNDATCLPLIEGFERLAAIWIFGYRCVGEEALELKTVDDRALRASDFLKVAVQVIAAVNGGQGNRSHRV